MDVKKMLQNGFEKVAVALLIGKDRNGKSHITVVDTPEHAKEYKAGEEMRLATMYRLPPESSAKGEGILGERAFSETIHSEPLDLCDVKFVTPDGNEVPSNYEAWESLPPLTIAGELSDEDKAKFLDDLSKGCLNLGFLFQKLRVTNVREEDKDKSDVTSCGNSAEWTQCKECIYFEDCQTKEDRDGCYFGEGGE